MAPSASTLTLEQLPDDGLVMVLQFVSVEDVLACRLVCQRLCGLALHRDVWHHRSLLDDHAKAAAVLHLAPCLGELAVTGEVPTLAAATTRCAVACLELYSYPLETFNASDYALAVRNQESLGRLRRLRVSIDRLSLKKTKADVLIRTVATCSGLDSLEVNVPLKTTHPFVHGPPSSSLTDFTCTVSGNSSSFANTILAGHAATLEEVEIRGSDLGSTTTADLLAALPRLRSLRCHSNLRGLEAVAECKTLRDVYVWCVEREFDGAAKFLRRAKQLRRVHLGNLAKDFSTVLVEALASSGRSCVEGLALEGVEEVPLLRKDVRVLFRALPSLPALRHLDVDAELDAELLQSITPATAPALRRLEVTAGEGRCPHAWVHGDAVKATLMENPLLHIQLWCHNSSNGFDPEECKVCTGDCHQGVKWHEEIKIGLYLHDPDTCSSPEDHTDNADWKRAFDRDNNVACTWIHM